MTKRLNILEIIFYLSLLVLAVWVILKSIGVIQTPVWLEYGVPILSSVISILTLYLNIIKKINKLDINFAVLSTKFCHLEKEVGILRTDVDLLKRKLI